MKRIMHSARCRIKNVDSLKVKIVKKLAKLSIDECKDYEKEKYRNINENNYYKIVTDLTGMRIIIRYSTLYEYMDSFIKRNKYEDNVMIADSVLNQCIIDYFADIYRLKEFHKIELINYVKIHAYTAYWLLRRKPLQIVKDDIENVNLAFINEKFVASYLVQFLRGEHDNVIIMEEDRPKYMEFVRNLEYCLRYRLVTPQMLETMIEAYQAGMAFEKAVH